MSRMQFKPWQAPFAELVAKLGEGEVAIRAEDGVFVRRPSGQPTATLQILNTSLPSLTVGASSGSLSALALVARDQDAQTAIGVINAHSGPQAEARVVASNGSSAIGLSVRGPGQTTDASVGYLFVQGANSLVVTTNSVERIRVSGSDGTVTVSAPSRIIGGSGIGALSSTDHPFQIGTDGGNNLIVDSSHIQARNNGAVAALTLNQYGGPVTVSSSGSTTAVGGSLSVAEAATFSSSVTVGHATLRSSVTTLTTVSPTLVDSFSAASYRSASYDVQITCGTSFHVCELRVLHNGTVAHLIEFGEIVTGDPLGTFTAELTGGEVRVLFTPASNAATDVKLFRSVLAA